MAIPQAQPQAPAGGLNQARPAPAAAPAPKQENLAARASGMEQEQATQPEDYFTKSMRDLQTQREALNTQIKTLKDSLDSRMGLPFDPMLLKVAAGFAKPTKTGSFGESMGYAAEAAVEEGEKEFARKQAMNKLKLELDQKMLDLTQQGAIMGHRMNRLGGGAPAGGPAGGPVGGPVGGPAGSPAPTVGGRAPSVPTPTGAPPQAATQAPQAREPVMSTGAPRKQKMITDEDIEQAYLLDPSGKYGKELAEIAKLQREDVKDIGGRPYSLSRQQFLEQNPDTIVEVDFGRYIGAKKVPFSVYQEWKTFHDKANAEGNRNIEFDWFKSKGWMEGEPSTKAGDGKAPLTLEERKTRDALIQERQKAQIGEEKTAISQIDTNMRSSRELINTSRDIKAIAQSNPRAFDLMNDDGIAAAVSRAAQKGIQAGNFGSITIPASELASYKLSKEDREALQMFAQKYAQLTVQFRKAARVPGEGATTEREGDLYAQLGAMPTDTAKVIRLKSEFVELKGRYDQEVFKAWNKFSKNPENSYRDFLASDELNRVNEAYDKRLGEMRSANAELFRNAPKPDNKKPAAAPAAPPAPAAPAAAPKPTSAAPAAPGQPPRIKGANDPVFQNLKPGSLYIDVDGTVRTKKKE
jgi:hypothetical protein